MYSFLDSLPRQEAAAIQASATPVSLSVGQVLAEPGQPFAYFYFPLTCVMSIITEFSDGRTIETASVGHEGVVGVPLALGAGTSHSRIVSQVPGEALRLPAVDAHEAFRLYPVFRQRTLLFADFMMATMAQSAACNSLHHLDQRTARWLLMTADRVDSNRFLLTHEFLATMLGVHRPSVSIAANNLREAGLIEYQRGHVTILDRKGLEALTCECYRALCEAREEYLRAGDADRAQAVR